MKVTIKVRPSGLYDGKPWPEVGKTIDLPEHVAEGMIAGGLVEKAERKHAEAKTEKRPASRKGVETREQD